MDLPADAYLEGDGSDLVRWARSASIEPTAICSNDVIEHVYDLEGHLDSLAQATSSSLRLVMASEANGANPRIPPTDGPDAAGGRDEGQGALS